MKNNKGFNDSIEKIRRSDHDTLIRLETKVDQIVHDIKELKDGVNVKISNLEIRVRSLEKIVSESEPVENIKKLDELYKWMIESRISIRLVIAIASILGAIVSFIIEF